jgi:hypothetical protein
MIAKIVQGRGFNGVVNYVLGKEKSRLLYSEGVRTKDKEAIISSFIAQSSVNPISKPVAHISLNFSAQDREKLTDAAMTGIALEYLKRMGYVNTQFIIARHNDREHPHVHLIINRIDNDGKTISDKNDRFRNEKVCRELKLKHGLYFADGKDEVKLDRLRDHDRVKYEIYHAVKDTLKTAKNWAELQKGLKSKQIELKFKYKGQTDTVQGISFIKDSVTFKGSEVDRSFSFASLDRKLAENGNQTVQKQNINAKREEPAQNSSCGIDSGTGIFDFQTAPLEKEEYDPYRLKRKKKRRLKL